MDTLIGMVVGVVATILVSHYYYRRSVRKSLGIYKTLNTQIFAGIDESVRRGLVFKYQDVEVADVQQLQFIIANDGERAISGVLEPLCLQLPSKVNLLDASILHRYPATLEAQLEISQTSTGPMVEFALPLMNKGDFVFVSLLLSGQMHYEEADFTIMAEDLPRTVSMKSLDTSALKDPGDADYFVLIILAVVGTASIAWFIYILFLLAKSRPELFPYPWKTFSVSLESGLVFLPSILFIFSGLFILLLFLGVGSGFLRLGPKFLLPNRFHPNLVTRLQALLNDLEQMR